MERAGGPGKGWGEGHGGPKVGVLVTSVEKKSVFVYFLRGGGRWSAEKRREAAGSGLKCWRWWW